MSIFNLVAQNSHYKAITAAIAGNTALQERLLFCSTGAAYFVAVLLVLLVVNKVQKITPSQLLTFAVLLHILGSAISRLCFGYSYDIPFIGPWFQYSDFAGFILACYWVGHFFWKGEDVRWQKIAAGFTTMHFFAMIIYFTFGFPNVSLKWTEITSLFFVFGLSAVTFLNQRNLFVGFRSNVPLYRNRRIYVLLLLAMPILVYFGSAAPPDNNIVQSSDLLGFAVNSPGLLHAHTGFGDEVWQIRYPAGIVGAVWLPSFLLASRSVEGSFIMWVFSWTLYVLAFASLSKRFGVPVWLAAILCVNWTVTGNAALHGGQIQELLAYSLGVFSVLWILSEEYLFAGLAVFSAVVLQPIVGLPFLVTAAVFSIYFLSKNTWNMCKSLIAPSLLSAASIIYIVYVGHNPGNINPSQPAILLSELTASLFVQNILRWFQSDSLGIWWVSALGVAVLIAQKKIKRLEMVVFFGWLLGAALIDGAFGATKWMVRFQSNYSSIVLWQLGWAGFAVFVVSRFERYAKWAKNSLVAVLMLCWVAVNGFSLGFTWKPVSVFVNHSDVHLMRLADGILPKGAKIFNMRPPENFNGWGQFCTGEMWRPCWNHGFGTHEIASGNTRGERQGACDASSEAFVTCLHNERFEYILLASRANSDEFAAKLLRQGAVRVLSIKSSYLLKVD
jgi:hypothetical protein